MSDTDKKVWLVTGAGRGMGVDIAKAALAAGNAVVAREAASEQEGRLQFVEVEVEIVVEISGQRGEDLCLLFGS